jgi:hypothetical protein
MSAYDFIVLSSAQFCQTSLWAKEPEVAAALVVVSNRLLELRKE